MRCRHSGYKGMGVSGNCLFHLILISGWALHLLLLHMRIPKVLWAVSLTEGMWLFLKVCISTYGKIFLYLHDFLLTLLLSPHLLHVCYEMAFDCSGFRYRNSISYWQRALSCTVQCQATTWSPVGNCYTCHHSVSTRNDKSGPKQGKDCIVLATVNYLTLTLVKYWSVKIIKKCLNDCEWSTDWKAFGLCSCTVCDLSRIW